MAKRICIIAGCLFFLSGSAATQCSSDRNGVKTYIIAVCDSAAIPINQRIARLTSYLHDMQSCRYRNDSIQVLLYQLIGYLYNSKKDFVTAITYYQRSIELLNTYSSNPAVNRKGLVSAYYRLVVLYDSLHNIKEKINAANNCIDIAVQLQAGPDFYYLRSLYERVKYNFDIGDYRSCINDAQMCEKLARDYINLLTADPRGILTASSIAQSSLGWCVEAQLLLGEYTAAEKFLHTKPDEYKKNGLENYIGYIYSQSAEVKMHQGDYEKALSFFQMSVQYNRRIGWDFGSKQVWNRVGKEIWFIHYANHKKALACYREALRYSRHGNADDLIDRMESLNIMDNIGNVYIRQGNYDSAFYYYRLALDQLQPGVTETGIIQALSKDPRKYPKVYFLENLFLDKADALQKKYAASADPKDIVTAVCLYRLADELLDRIRSVQEDVGSKLFWRTDTRRLYDHAISACYASAQTEAAFYFFEKSRAVLLNDQLARQHTMNVDDLVLQAPVRKKIVRLEQEAAGYATGSALYNDAQSALFAARQELADLERKQTAAVNDQAPTLVQVQKNLLQDDGSLLSIFAGDSAVYTLLVTKAYARLRRIDKQEFETAASLFSDYVSDRSALNRGMAMFRETAASLYRLLFQDDTLPPGSIIISPDGRLFPFEALVVDNSGRDPVYFLSRHATSYTYSAGYLLRQFASAQSRISGNLLGVAPLQSFAAMQLPALNGSDASLQRIATGISYACSLTGQQASRGYFLNLFPQYKIIQLYTHATDSSSRNEPAIYFADSCLYLSELVPEQKPVAQLIVLSACETANGTLYKGEGVFSFNRGFAMLGIPSSVSNLWSIDNASTYQLTEFFYKYISLGLPLDKALQQAKLEYLEKASAENRLPYYWAPAVLIGKTDAINNKRPASYLSFLFIIGGGLLVSVLMFRVTGSFKI